MEQQRAQVRRHIFILAAIVAASLVLRFDPAPVLRYGPGCVLRTFLGIHCPFCGMTRDFVAILHRQQPSLNRFSWMAAATVYLVYPVLFLWAWRRQRLSWFHQPIVYRAIAVVLTVMLVVNNLPR